MSEENIIKVPFALFKANALMSNMVLVKNPDGSFSAKGNLDLHSRNLTALPMRFKEVAGHCFVDHNWLVTLDGCPKTVGGGFYCYHNNLTSLEGAPNEVGGDFHCDHNTVKFTVEDVKAVCDVKGEIYV
ncbi:MAG: hypothetical protein V1709_08610 [Planctomycetota bacterium]